MPADYSSTAQALSLPTSPSPVPSATSPRASRDDDDDRDPPWVRSAGPGRSPNARRLSAPYARNSGDGGSLRQHRGGGGGSGGGGIGQSITRAAVGALNRLVRLWQGMSATQRVLAAAGGAVLLALAVVFLAFSGRIFGALAPVAQGWRRLRGGWVLVFLPTFLTAFPPLLGYSTTVTVAGFVYGFPGGWPVAAAATVAGSTAAFAASRTALGGYVQRLAGGDRRFVALGHVLRHDGLAVLAAIRFCPLPYSLSNGFLATIPSISPAGFALATALATPKLLVHVFIGSRLAALAEQGGDMSFGDRAVNYLSMLLGGLLGTAVGLVIYRRTMRRADELARRDPGGDRALDDVDDDDHHRNGDDVDIDIDDDAAVLPDPGEYEDLEEGVVARDPRGGGRVRRGEAHDDDAAALVMDDDDISLWDQDDGFADDDFYRDDEAQHANGHGSK
ncbi:hypothetical protein GGR56DRAFT_209155 [Xylariaceae sp. FL0804]|nr:hypothetical protein GGR56DRAFT_209155 [Xylariaceae sp. FL0804]